jgi:hypothetical protein
MIVWFFLMSRKRTHATFFSLADSQVHIKCPISGSLVRMALKADFQFPEKYRKKPEGRTGIA